MKANVDVHKERFKKLEKLLKRLIDISEYYNVQAYKLQTELINYEKAIVKAGKTADGVLEFISNFDNQEVQYNGLQDKDLPSFLGGKEDED